jgi:regulator of nucleoside diphosphate kinase
MTARTIDITEFDMERLTKLVQDAQFTNYRKSEYLEKLEKELQRAELVKPEEVPSDVVTMNSRVRMIDVESREEMTLALEFPQDADIDQNKISVLAPIGTAMLGYRLGDTFEWVVPDGVRKLRIEEILYQPEASGDYHL